jgi:predicted ATP-grasp superfamily ATP-dependent carboligase
VVDYGLQGFNADALLAAINTLDLSYFAGFVYGSGFEAQPQLLVKISALLPLIGNSAETIVAVKTPAIFFAKLQQLEISHPQVLSTLPDNDFDDFVIKYAGGCGGTHIRPVNADCHELPAHYYCQQKLSGRPLSLLFLANGHDIDVIGFNEQWLNPGLESPYRYGGAVSHADISVDAQQQLIAAAKKLTVEFGLLGLNSLDALVQTSDQTSDVVSASEQVAVLEINPRLSATVDLYTQPNLFARHVQACLPPHSFSPPDDSRHDVDVPHKSHAIVYAEFDVELMMPIAWPDWVLDNPLQSPNQLISGLKIKSGAPVCTVIAYASDAETAKNMAQSRVKIIHNLLK